MATRRPALVLAALVLAALLPLALGLTVPAAAEAVYPLALTASQLEAAWGAPSARLATGPYAEEYRVTRDGVEVTYALRFGPDGSGQSTVQECYARFAEAVPLGDVPRLVPEVAGLLATPGVRFTYFQLPLRSYAQDVLVYAYPPEENEAAGAERPAVMFLPQGFGFGAAEVTATLPVKGVVLYQHTPAPGEVGILNPLR